MRLRLVPCLCALSLLSGAAPLSARTSETVKAAWSRKAVNGAGWSAKLLRPRGRTPALLKAQILLDRARFSPGLIDGADGGNMRKAVKAFQREHHLAPTGKLTQQTWKKLAEVQAGPPLTTHKITEQEVKGPFTPKIPAGMKAQAKLKRLGYTSAGEELGEQFHTDPRLLKALNPGKPLNQAGAEITVPNVYTKPPAEKGVRVEVNKEGRFLRVLDRAGKLLAFYPATVGSSENPAPTGKYKVTGVAENPVYYYNPTLKFKGLKDAGKFRIAPGPNNPVGAVWIDLNKPHFGIHGTPDPAKVGKSYSHGCVRLTNWDVRQLARMVHRGTPVVFK